MTEAPADAKSRDRGFIMVPSVVLFDDKLSPSAFSVYVQLLDVGQQWLQDVPGLSELIGIPVPELRPALDELEAAGYICRSLDAIGKSCRSSSETPGHASFPMPPYRADVFRPGLGQTWIANVDATDSGFELGIVVGHPTEESLCARVVIEVPFQVEGDVIRAGGVVVREQ